MIWVFFFGFWTGLFGLLNLLRRMKSVSIQKYQLTQNRHLLENKIAQPLNETHITAELWFSCEKQGFKGGPYSNCANFGREAILYGTFSTIKFRFYCDQRVLVGKIKDWICVQIQNTFLTSERACSVLFLTVPSFLLLKASNEASFDEEL